jgi:TRAP-type transport system periplasmic protein
VRSVLWAPLGIIAAISLLLAGCAGTAPPATTTGGANAAGTAVATKTYHFRVATDTIANTTQFQAVQDWVDAVKRDTNGAVTFDTYPGAQLGKEDALLPQVENGSIDAALVSTGPLGTQAKEISVLDLPYLFKSPLDEKKLLDGTVGSTIQSLVAKNNLQVMGWETFGTRELLSTRPVQSLADLKGLKVRVPNTDALVGTFKQLGAEPVPLAFPETYTSLQSGVVQAVEVAPESFVQNKFYEVAKNMTMTDHATLAAALLFNAKTWATIPSDLQQILLRDAQDATQKQWTADATQRQGFVDQLKGFGVSVYTIDQSTLSNQLTDFKQQFVASTGATTIWDAVKAAQ